LREEGCLIFQYLIIWKSKAHIWKKIELEINLLLSEVTVCRFGCDVL